MSSKKSQGESVRAITKKSFSVRLLLSLLSFQGFQVLGGEIDSARLEVDASLPCSSALGAEMRYLFATSSSFFSSFLVCFNAPRFSCVSRFRVISIAHLDYFSHLFTISSSTPGKCQYHYPLGRYARALADFGMCCRLDEHTARHFGHRGLCFRRLGRVEALVWKI